SKIITSILSFISGRLATKSNQIKQLIRNGRSASLQRTFKKSFTSFSHSTRNKTRDGLIRVRNIRALNGRDRKSGSAGMPRPISYAVFCLKKKSSVDDDNLIPLRMEAEIRDGTVFAESEGILFDQ